MSSALLAEGLALLEAVRTGVEEEQRNMSFGSDSALVIKAVNSGTCVPELYAVVSDIQSLYLCSNLCLLFGSLERGMAKPIC